MISPAVQAKALLDAPYPFQDNQIETETNERKSDLSISFIERSNVIKIELLDEQKEWSVRYITALIDAYRKARLDIFGSEAQSIAVEENIKALNAE
ncbi:hypothetical protein AB9F27_22240, partial [Falsihalocynthiibacter sp. CO-5D18]